MPQAVRADLPGIETATHLIYGNELKVSVPVTGSQSPGEFKKQKDIVYADEFYFSLLKATG